MLLFTIYLRSMGLCSSRGQRGPPDIRLQFVSRQRSLTGAAGAVYGGHLNQQAPKETTPVLVFPQRSAIQGRVRSKAKHCDCCAESGEACLVANFTACIPRNYSSRSCFCNQSKTASSTPSTKQEFLSELSERSVSQRKLVDLSWCLLLRSALPFSQRLRNQ